jgi:hypothetical protein
VIGVRCSEGAANFVVAVVWIVMLTKVGEKIV